MILPGQLGQLRMHFYSQIPANFSYIQHMEPSLNVWGKPLAVCSTHPLTGFFRNGCCDTSAQDHGMHTVCAVMTKEFLSFSKVCGNDLSTPLPTYQFPGLKPGDKWCLCLSRWLEAYNAGMAPKIYLHATHQQVLEHIPLNVLEKFALDPVE